MNEMPPRDLRAEEITREFAGWAEAQGYDATGVEYNLDEMRDAFHAGMQAQRDLDAVTGDGTLRTRITRLAETWEAHPQLTEEGRLLRELGEILRDELHHASDREAQPAPGGADVLDITREVLTAAVQGKRVMLQLGSKPKPKAAPEPGAAVAALARVRAVAEAAAKGEAARLPESPKGALARQILEETDPQ